MNAGKDELKRLHPETGPRQRGEREEERHMPRSSSPTSTMAAVRRHGVRGHVYLECGRGAGVKKLDAFWCVQSARQPRLPDGANPSVRAPRLSWPITKRRLPTSAAAPSDVQG